MHDGKKLPRWKPRSHRTMNMGLSAKHVSTVPLVLSLDTGYINSQFNIVFDNWFATVVASVDALPDLNSPEWAEMFGESTFQFEFDEDDANDTIDLNRDLPEALARSHHVVARAMDQYHPDVPLNIPPPAAEPLLSPPTPPIPVETVDDDLPRPP
jgi:1,4-alpha-glucan branching enzyme